MRSQEYFYLVIALGVLGYLSVLLSSLSKHGNPGTRREAVIARNAQRNQRRINRVTKAPTKEELILIEEERVAKTKLILEALGSRNTSELVMPYEDTIIVHPHKKLSGGRKPFAVILVTSLADDVERRAAIRETWYSWGNELNCLIYFFMGLPTNETLEAIREEANLHGDVIVEDFTEAYYKLTIKTLRMLKWYLSEYKEDPPFFFIKTDQDVFLNMPLVIPHLMRVASTQKNYIGGMRYVNNSAHRNPHSKWYVPESVYATEKFPTYAAGPCYFIEGRLVEEIYNESFQVPLIHLEDVYLLGLVANQRLNLTITDVKNIVEDPRVTKLAIRSRFRPKKILVFHPIESDDVMRSLFLKLTANSRRNKAITLKVST